MRQTLIAIMMMCAAIDASAQQRIAARTAVMPQATGAVAAYLNVRPSALDRDALAALGVEVDLDLGDIVTVRVPAGAIGAVADVAGVEYVQAATGAQPMLDIVRTETGGAAMNSGEGLSQPFTGKGVVVGVVDCGFDYCHAAFRRPDGTLRIQRVWEQSTTPAAGQSAPEAFGYGLELATPEAIEAAGGDMRAATHGTHVAGCAAGSAMHDDGTLRGMANDADIVLVSMVDAGTNNVNISNAIAYIFDYADAVGKPCVVNLSLGGHSGPHDGTSTFDQIADRLQGPGRIVVGSAGNHRDNRFHIRRDHAEQPLSTFIEYVNALSVKNAGGDIEIWADGEFSVSLVLYKLSTGAEVARAAVEADGQPQSLALGRNVTGTLTASAEVSPLNGKRHVAINSAVTAMRTDHAIAIEVTPAAPCTLDIWADNTSLRLTSNGKEGFTAPTADEPTICEIGGTARRITSVGAYTTRNTYTLFGETTAHTLDETVGDLCSFSSCGPTADGRRKPDITAPGSIICAPVSQYENPASIMLGRYYTEADGTVTKYGFMQGTSMSSPIVAGIVAAWLEACPTLTPEALAGVLASTARTDEYAVAGPQWGCGKIDALAGAAECVRMAAGTASVRAAAHPAIHTATGIRTSRITAPGLYIIGGRKTVVR